MLCLDWSFICLSWILFWLLTSFFPKQLCEVWEVITGSGVCATVPSGRRVFGDNLLLNVCILEELSRNPRVISWYRMPAAESHILRLTISVRRSSSIAANTIEVALLLTLDHLLMVSSTAMFGFTCNFSNDWQLQTFGRPARPHVLCLATKGGM